MDIHSLLHANCKKLLEQYTSNIDGVLFLQATLIKDVLPGVADELELDTESIRWAKDWLEDSSYIFQNFRRHRFTRSFAIQSMRDNLMWRLNVLRPQLTGPLLRKYHILPNPDPFGRPIIVVRISDLKEVEGTLKNLLIPTMEDLRVQLKSFNDSRFHGGSGGSTLPILQYVVLLDLAGLTIQNIDIDLISWTMRELIPRFPGMLAAVFMLNYTWAHSGIWAVVKRVLPTAALSRVLFPSKQELLQYFSASSLPEEYGGTLLPLVVAEQPISTEKSSQNGPAPSKLSVPSHKRTITRPYIPPMSSLNPFFGYPLSPSDSLHAFNTGRRRKRDLLRTLAGLWWVRWKSHIHVCLWVTVCILGMWVWLRRRVRMRGSVITWRAILASFGWSHII